MKGAARIAVLLTAVLLCLCSCEASFTALGGLSLIYLATALMSLLSLCVCIAVVKCNDVYMISLFGAVCVINIGYFILSVSGSLELALWANRIAYLGSAFLPFIMLMIVLRSIDCVPKRRTVYLLFGISALMFVFAATPPYLDLYYKSASLGAEGGATVLIKEYGPLHVIYKVYLFAFTAIAAAFALRGAITKRLSSVTHTVMLNVAVFVNVGLWLIEQFIATDFELLSVSYVISELFLLGLYKMQEEFAVISASRPSAASEEEQIISDDVLNSFRDGLSELTPTERSIYELYLEGKRTKDVLALKGITENTLKYHNKNIYGKLGVSSRKELLSIAKRIT